MTNWGDKFNQVPGLNNDEYTLCHDALKGKHRLQRLAGKGPGLQVDGTAAPFWNFAETRSLTEEDLVETT